MIRLGFWWTAAEPDLPRPHDHIVPLERWYPGERAAVLAHLRTRGETVARYRGFSTCRLCGYLPNGSEDVSDGVYLWPSGLAHYVTQHDVRLPWAFVEHVLTSSREYL